MDGPSVTTKTIMIVFRQLPSFATVAPAASVVASPAQRPPLWPPPKMTGSISKCSCSFRSLSKIVRKMGCHTAVPHVEKSAKKNKLTQGDFTNFSMQDSPYSHSVSGCLSFTFKICQTVAGTSMIRQSHDFLKSYFWRVFLIWPNIARRLLPTTYLFFSVSLQTVH